MPVKTGYQITPETDLPLCEKFFGGSAERRLDDPNEDTCSPTGDGIQGEQGVPVKAGFQISRDYPSLDTSDDSSSSGEKAERRLGCNL